MRTPPAALSPSDLQRRLADLPGWRVGAGTIERTWEFTDFRAAFDFMTRVAADAEALDHHPEWTVRWRVVDVRTTTHDAGGLTARDAALVAAIDALAAAPPA